MSTIFLALSLRVLPVNPNVVNLVHPVTTPSQATSLLDRFLKVKFFGKEIEATVYGYMNDNVLINGSPAQIVKLLVQTNDGPKFILYQLGDIKQPYGIKTTLKLKVYKDIFLIVNKQQYYFLCYVIYYQFF